MRFVLNEAFPNSEKTLAVPIAAVAVSIVVDMSPPASCTLGHAVLLSCGPCAHDYA